MTTTASALDTIAVASPSALVATPVATMRTLVLAFLILAGSLAAAVAVPAQDAGAVSPCTVSANVYKYGSSQVYGHGSSNCSSPISAASPPQQWIYVQLYKNGTLIDSHGWFASNGTTWAIQGSTHAWSCTPGAVYKTVVTHKLNGQQSQHASSKTC